MHELLVSRVLIGQRGNSPLQGFCLLATSTYETKESTQKIYMQLHTGIMRKS